MKLRVSQEVATLLRSLHPQLKRKIKTSLQFILEDPACGKLLREELAGLRSYRVGRFRIVYRLSGTVVEIVAVGPRERIYEETYLLVRKEGQQP